MGIKTVAENRKARFDYFIEDTYECGIVLKGSEIKSVRQNGVSLKEAWCDIENGELYIKQMYIKPYEKGMQYELKKQAEGRRVRKLLAHKREISVMWKALQQEGMTLVPLEVYLKDSQLKVLVAIAKGKKLYDKRDVMAKQDAQRAIERAIKERN